MIGIVPDWTSQRQDKTKKKEIRIPSQERRAHTHCNAHAEQTTHNLIDDGIQVLVASLPTVDLVVRIISET